MTAAPLGEDPSGPKAHLVVWQAEPLLSQPPASLLPPAPPLDLSPTPSGLSSLLGSLSPPPKPERGDFETGFLWFDLPPDSGPVVSLPAAPTTATASVTQLPPQQPTQLAEQYQQPQVAMMDLQHAQQEQQQQQQQQQRAPSSSDVASGSAGGKRGSGRSRGHGAAAGPIVAPSETELQAEKQRKEEERRARNRATQARFRERQKAKNEARLQEYAATEAALRRSRSEREQLEAEQAVLQKMLATKDAHIAALPPSQASGAAPGAGPDAVGRVGGRPPGPAQLQLLPPLQPGQPAGGAADSGSSGSSGMHLSRSLLRHLSSSDLGTAPLSSAVAEQMGKLSSNLAAHLAQLELPVGADPDQAMAVAQANLPGSPTRQAALQGAPADMQLSCAEAAAAAAGGAGGGAAEPGAAGGGISAAAAGGRKLEDLMRERPDLVQKVQTITPEEFVSEWRQQALAIRAVLETHDVAGASEAELARVVHFLKEFSCVMGLALRLRPEVVQVLFATAADAPPGQWEAVAAAIAPTRAQRTTIRQLWHAYAGQVQALSAERAAAIQAVHHAAAHAPAAAGAAGRLPADTLGDVMSRYLGLFDAAGKLSTLRDAEFIAMLQFLGRTGLVFSPVQKARLAAVSCPHFPDIVQVARLLAEGGEAEA